jgi:hypothetical protein
MHMVGWESSVLSSVLASFSLHGIPRTTHSSMCRF